MAAQKRLCDIPARERPREKLRFRGPQALSDQELLAIMLGSGTRSQDVMSIAARLLALLDQRPTAPEPAELLSVQGVGPAKATLVAAALEFARRRIRPEGCKVAAPADILPLIQHYSDRKQEHFLCTSLSGGNEVIATRLVSLGLVDKTRVHPREVFAGPLTDRASAVIVAHNHPLGALRPSGQDLNITRRLKEAGDTLGVRLLDHIIFNHAGYYSFLENGNL